MTTDEQSSAAGDDVAASRASEVVEVSAPDQGSTAHAEVDRITALGAASVELGPATTVDELASHVETYQRLHAELRDAMADIDSA